MPDIFQQILIIYKKHNSEARVLAHEIKLWLNTRGIGCSVQKSGEQPAEIRPDCLVVLGGDGTILGVARRFAGKGIPIFGVNFGKVGFLTTAETVDWPQKLEQAIHGGMPVRNCLALHWRISRKGRIINAGVAANDVVLSRTGLARLMTATISINNTSLGVLRSDGIVVCTPLGSSGYNLSAGGPLLYVGMNAMGLTPICPFLTHISPLVFPGYAEFDFEIGPTSAECHLTVDGQEGQELESGDRVLVQGAPDSLKFLADDCQFFTRLGARGFKLESADFE